MARTFIPVCRAAIASGTVDMPNRSRTRKCRNVGIGNADSFSKVVGKSSEARAEDEPDLRPQGGLRKHKRCCGFGASKEIWGHRWSAEMELINQVHAQTRRAG